MVLTWQDNATSETSYIVERSLPGVAGYELLAALSADATSYTDSDDYLTNGIFDYRLKAVDDTTESDYAYTSARYGGLNQTQIYLPLIGKAR